MSWRDRLNEKMRLRGDAQHSLDAALQINALNIVDVEAMKYTVSTDGWGMYENELRKDLAGKQKILEELAIDPENKKFEIAYYGATCALIRKQLSFVSGVLGKESSLLIEQRRLDGLPSE